MKADYIYWLKYKTNFMQALDHTKAAVAFCISSVKRLKIRLLQFPLVLIVMSSDKKCF